MSITAKLKEISFQEVGFVGICLVYITRYSCSNKPQRGFWHDHMKQKLVLKIAAIISSKWQQIEWLSS